MCGPTRSYIARSQAPCGGGVEYIHRDLRVVGGDEKGSLKFETVKYGRKSLGTTTEKDCAGKGQRHIHKTDPSSRQRGRPTE
jgi:hypothetical protein